MNKLCIVGIIILMIALAVGLGYIFKNENFNLFLTALVVNAMFFMFLYI